LQGDRTMLRRALSNLLDNALRFTPSGGSVTMMMAQTAKGVELSISNDGSTIAPEILPRLFDRFYRADPARQEGTEHAGLGLAITQSIIRAHGGSIRCESTAGTTRFLIELPA
jgi:two-component system heavy metal sensor histidine kinase CusS